MVMLQKSDYLVVLFVYVGVYWPLESFGKVGKFAARLGPVTYASESLRAILQKGVLYIKS